MVLPIALALMAGGAYNKTKADEAARQRDDEDRFMRMADYEAKQNERAAKTQKLQTISEAAKPVTVTTEQMSGPTMPDQEPLPTLPKAGGKFYTSMTEANAAADAANTPEARVGRVSDALLGMGDMNGAMKLQSDAQQLKAGKLQLDETQRAHANKVFDDALGALGSFDDLATTVNTSGIGGKTQVKVMPGADGKTITFHAIGDDGSTTPTAYSFPNTAEGLAEAKLAMSRSVPINQKVDYLYKKDLAKRQAEKDAADLALRRDALGETVKHNRAAEGIAASRVGAAGERADGAATLAERRAMLTGLREDRLASQGMVDALTRQLKAPGMRGPDRQRLMGELAAANANLQRANSAITAMTSGGAQGSAAPTPATPPKERPPLSSFMKP